MTRVLGIVCGVVLAGCEAVLPLPSTPTDEGVAVSSVEPSQGFARDVVTITGEGFGDDATLVRVTFGAAAPVQPRRVEPGVLEVEVPGDATDGPVTVEAPRGRGTAGNPFDFLGLGRLRAGLVAAETSLRVLPELVVPVGPDFFVIDASRYEQAAWVDDGLAEPLGLSHVRAAAVRPGQSSFAAVVLDVDDDGAPPDTRCPGHLVVLLEPAVLRRIPLHSSVIGCRPFTHVAVDPSGDWAVVAGSESVVVVDLESGAKSAFEPRALGPVASLGNAEFVVALSNGLARLHRSGGTWTLVQNAEVLENGFDWPIALAGRADGALAFVAGSGRTTVLDASDWPPVVERRFGFSHHFATRGSLAWSEDGDALAFTHDDAAAVSVWTRDGAAVGTLELDSPRGITASGDYFFVARAGGWTAVLASTGGRIDGGELASGIAGTVVRPVVSSSNGRTQPMLEVVASSFGRVLRLDPATLQPVQGFDALPLADGDRPTWAGHVGDSLVLLRGNALSRIGPEPGAVEQPVTVSLGANVLAQSARGFGASGILFVYGFDAQLLADVIVVVDFQDGFDSVQARRVAVPLESTLSAEGDSIVLTDATRVRVWDRETFVTTGPSAAPRLERSWTDALVRTSTVGRGSYVVVLQWEGTQRLERLDLASGTWTVGASAPLPAGSVEGLALSPSGRHLWMVAGQRAPSLFGWPLDAADPGVPDPAIAVSPGVRDPLVFPDGEGLVLVDTFRDGLQLVR